jgi:hypothetical protein
LRGEGQRKVFVFRDHLKRRDDVLAFYGDSAAVPRLVFSAIIKEMKDLLHNAWRTDPEKHRAVRRAATP